MCPIAWTRTSQYSNTSHAERVKLMGSVHSPFPPRFRTSVHPDIIRIALLYSHKYFTQSLCLLRKKNIPEYDMTLLLTL